MDVKAMTTEQLQALLRQDCEMAADLDMDVCISATEELLSRLGNTGKDAREAWGQFVRKNLTEASPGTKLEKMSTQDLRDLLKQLLAGEQKANLVWDVLKELQSREPELTPEDLRILLPVYLRIFYPEPILDPTTGTMLQPSYHGQDCPGNGAHPDVECCCDECDYLMACWADYRPGRIWDEDRQCWI